MYYLEVSAMNTRNLLRGFRKKSEGRVEATIEAELFHARWNTENAVTEFPSRISNNHFNSYKVISDIKNYKSTANRLPKLFPNCCGELPQKFNKFELGAVITSVILVNKKRHLELSEVTHP